MVEFYKDWSKGNEWDLGGERVSNKLVEWINENNKKSIKLNQDELNQPQSCLEWLLSQQWE